MRPVTLLIDENLSPRVAHVLREEGLDVVHVRDRGLLSGTDSEVFARAFEEDRIVVTSNIGDFARLAEAAELHTGVILVEPGGLLRDEQEVVVRRAVKLIAEEYASARDMVNRALRIQHDGPAVFENVPRGR